MADVGLRLVMKERDKRRVNRLLRSINPEKNRRIWQRSLTRMAILVQNNAKRDQIIRGNKGGRVDDVRLTSRSYTLVNSIVTDFTSLPDVSRVMVPENVPYGFLHEVVGVGKAKKRRPFLAPALAAEEPNFARIAIQVIENEMAT